MGVLVREQRISLLGIVKNGGEEFARTLNEIESCEQVFPFLNSYLITNDNEDGTTEALRSWASNNPRRVGIELDGLDRSMPDRFERLAYLRNLCVVYSNLGSDRLPDVIVVADLDGPNIRNLCKNIRVALRYLEKDFSGVFPVQSEGYYDIYALRHPSWCAEDWIVRLSIEMPLILRSKRIQRIAGALRLNVLVDRFRSRYQMRARKRLVYNRQVAIPEDFPIIEVDSAFGGLGVYRGEAFAGCWYSSRDCCGRQTCEHVALHAQMREMGLRLVVVPEMRNVAPVMHLDPEGTTSIRPADLIRL